MERDALLAHGTSFLLQDRLMNCSDYSTSWICRVCGSLISLGFESTDRDQDHDVLSSSTGPNGEYCKVCRADDNQRKEDGLEPIKGKRRTKDGQVMKIPKENVLKSSGSLDVVAVPYVLKYLAAELASMGLRISFEVE